MDQGSGTEDRGSSAAVAAVAGAASALVAGALFEQVFKVHPGATTRTAKEACRRMFMALLRAGVDADRIVADAKACAAEFAQPDGPRAHETPARLMTWLEGYKLAAQSKPTAQAVPTISNDAYEIAREIGKALGHDAESVPPSFYGAPLRVQSWLNKGWPRDVILPAVMEMAAKKVGNPPSRIEYFEKGIADAMARANAPLPTGNARPPNPSSKEAFREKHSLVASIDRLFARLPPGENEDAVLLLPSGPVR